MRKSDAEKNLRRLADELAAHAKDYASGETFISHDLLMWLSNGVSQAANSELTLGQCLGLEAPPHRPSKDAIDPNMLPDSLYRAWKLRLFADLRQERARAKGRAVKRMTWPDIAKMTNHQGDPNDLGRQVRDHHIVFSKRLAQETMERWKSRDKTPA